MSTTKQALNQILNWSIILWIFLLPWQTRWITNPDAANEFVKFGIYAFDIWFVVLVTIYSIWWFMHKKAFNVDSVFWIIAGTFTLLTVVTYFSDADGASFAYWLRIIQALIGFAIIYTTKIPALRILLTLVINGVVQSGLVLWQVLTQHIPANTYLGIAEHVPTVSGVSVIATTSERLLRGYGGMPHPNSAAAIILLGSIAAIIAWNLSKSQWIKSLLVAGGAITGFGMVLTFSRAAVLVWVGIVLLAILLRYTGLRVITATLLGAVVIGSLFSSAIVSRITVNQYTETYSLDERANQTNVALKTLEDVWPYGIGIGTSTLVERDDTKDDVVYAPAPVHNMLLLIAVESGIFMAILWYLIPLWGITKTKRSSNAGFGTMLLVVACVGLSLFDHYFWTLPTMVILWWMVLGLHFREN